MIVILPFVLLGLGVGIAAGGSFRNFDAIRIRWWGLAIAGPAVQLLPVEGERWLGSGLLIVSYGLMLTFVFCNRKLPGAWILAVGLLMNLAVVAPNVGMPVSADAIRVASEGEVVDEAWFSSDARHHLMTDDDVMRPLGDVVPIPSPVKTVVSPGDIVLYAGVGIVTFLVLTGRFDPSEIPEPRRRRDRYRGRHIAR
jgi:hypothetical protein